MHVSHVHTASHLQVAWLDSWEAVDGSQRSDPFDFPRLYTYLICPYAIALVTIGLERSQDCTPTTIMPTDEKPSRNEDEYFARQNAEAIREMRAKLDAERARSERQSIKCPRCGIDLVERETDNVKIDVCPTCNGIWLDSGELEQLRRVNHGRGVTSGVLGSLFRRD